MVSWLGYHISQKLFDFQEEGLCETFSHEQPLASDLLLLVSDAFLPFPEENECSVGMKKPTVVTKSINYYLLLMRFILKALKVVKMGLFSKHIHKIIARQPRMVGIMKS